MKKNITAFAVGVLLGCATTAAYAESWLQLEAGVGVASFNTLGDDMYYQDGFSHNFDLHVPAGRVGIRVNAIAYHPGSFIPGLALHLDYLNFGSVHISSDDAQDPQDFSSKGQSGGYDTSTKGCYSNNCGAFRHFASSGGLQVLALTVEPYWEKAGWRFGVEAGPTLYRSTWTATATVTSPTSPWGPAGSVEVLQHTPHIQVGMIVGASIGRGPYSVRYNYVFVRPGPSTGKDIPAGFSGAHMLTFNYTLGYFCAAK